MVVAEVVVVSCMLHDVAVCCRLFLVCDLWFINCGLWLLLVVCCLAAVVIVVVDNLAAGVVVVVVVVGCGMLYVVCFMRFAVYGLLQYVALAARLRARLRVAAGALAKLHPRAKVHAAEDRRLAAGVSDLSLKSHQP